MADILNDKRFVSVEAIHKGWSGDKKYRVVTVDGKHLLLRISDASKAARKKKEYVMLARAYRGGVLVPKPIEFGRCNDGIKCYSLTAWLDGEDAEAVLPTLSGSEQYAVGVKTGELLKHMHSIPASEDVEDWEIRFKSKIGVWLDKYKFKKEVHSEIGDKIVSYLNVNYEIIGNRPQTFVHGDFNTENIILTPNGEVGVIDFNCYNSGHGDPWMDINNFAWMPTMYPNFYAGQIDGYFGGNPPQEFWKVLSYYLAYDALAALTDPNELNGIADGMYVVNNILAWTENLTNPVPTWYIEAKMRLEGERWLKN